MSKRFITERQEEILRLCHHEFEGLSQTEASKKLGVSQKVISETLARVKKIAPQFFPILTKFEFKVYNLYTLEGWKTEEIADYLNISKQKIYKAFQRAKNKLNNNG